MLAPPRELTPPLRGNPGPATELIIGSLSAEIVETRKPSSPGSIARLLIDRRAFQGDKFDQVQGRGPHVVGGEGESYYHE